MRPDWVYVGSVKVSIQAHDAYYRAEKRAWRTRLVKVHPDKRRFRVTTRRKSGSIATCGCGNLMHASATMCQQCYLRTIPAGRFLSVHAAFRSWMKRERQWYAQYDLDPPDANVETVPIETLNLSLSATN